MLLAALLGAAPSVHAWNDTGHMLTAMLAYDALPPPLREESVRVLRAHPRFEADFAAHMPRRLRDASAAEQDRWVFAFAATWPDLARHFEHVGPSARREALIERYHRPRWHYINLPHFLDEADRRALGEVDANVSFDWREAESDEAFNVVQALAHASDRYRSAQADDAERAVLLCWLLHLLGDLHQPLHTTALFASEAFPSGDRGGNALEIDSRTNLHALWDGALGSQWRWDDLLGQLEALGAREQPDAQALRIEAPLSKRYARWAREGHRLAGEHVYVPEILERIAAANTRPRRAVRIELPEGYRSAMRGLARERAVLAGLRTARVLSYLERSE